MLLVFGLFSLFIFFKGIQQSLYRGKAFATTPYLVWMGIFVWGDALIIAPFWILACLVTVLLNEMLLFPLLASMFWTVRGVGETIYWIQEQFASNHRNAPDSLFGHNLFKGELIWVVYQLVWQCVTVVAIICSIYFAHLWLLSSVIR